MLIYRCLKWLPRLLICSLAVVGTQVASYCGTGLDLDSTNRRDRGGLSLATGYLMQRRGVFLLLTATLRFFAFSPGALLRSPSDGLREGYLIPADVSGSWLWGKLTC